MCKKDASYKQKLGDLSLFRTAAHKYSIEAIHETHGRIPRRT